MYLPLLFAISVAFNIWLYLMYSGPSQNAKYYREESDRRNDFNLKLVDAVISLKRQVNFLRNNSLNNRKINPLKYTCHETRSP